MTVCPPYPPFGSRLVIICETTEITPEISRTSMTITSSWEYTERLDLMDTLDGETHVACHNLGEAGLTNRVSVIACGHVAIY